MNCVQHFVLKVILFYSSYYCFPPFTYSPFFFSFLFSFSIVYCSVFYSVPDPDLEIGGGAVIQTLR